MGSNSNNIYHSFYNNNSNESQYKVNTVELGRLPRWFVCGVGTIAYAILGGLTGIGGGFVIAGPLGAVVGGIIGVISGAVSGAASLCN